MKIEMYFDGACEPMNPGGNMGLGCYIHSEGELIFEHSEFIPAHYSNSNNVAEYSALLAGFRFMIEKGFSVTKENEINVYGDSMLVIQQMNGMWRIKGGRYSSKAREALRLLSEFECQIYFRWIQREDNYRADELSKKGMIKAGVEFKLQKI